MRKTCFTDEQIVAILQEAERTSLVAELDTSGAVIARYVCATNERTPNYVVKAADHSWR